MPFFRLAPGKVGLAMFVISGMAGPVMPGWGTARADCGCHLLDDRAVQARTGWRADWTVQLPLDPSRFQVSHVAVAEDLVVAQTSDGGIHAISWEKSATRGTIRWSRRIGEPHRPVHPATIGPTRVSVATDRELHGLDRSDGSTVVFNRFPGLVEASGSEIAGFLHVPLAGGTILRTPADPAANRERPLEIASDGLLRTNPFPLGEDSLGWITSDGKLVSLQPVADTWEHLKIQLPSPAVGDPIVRGGDVLLATTVGDVVRLRLRRTSPFGLEPLWRMPLPGVPDGRMIEDRKTLFVSLGIDGIAAVATETGAILWHERGSAVRFGEGMGLVAAGAGRVWCVDAVGRLLLLDAATGSRVGCVPLDGFTLPVVSTTPGRLVLARPDGRLMAFSPADSLTTAAPPASSRRKNRP